MYLPSRSSFDEFLSQLTRVGLPAQPVSPRKVLFWGERAGEISSYVAGWLAGKGIDVIVLDGANRFNPYIASAFARKTLIPPERLLKRIRIARAFTCHQMAVMVGERLSSLLHQEETGVQSERRWVVVLGLINTFLDEDVSEREVRPLFERSLRKMEKMSLCGIPFLLFQPSVLLENSPLNRGGKGGLINSKRTYLTRGLFQFSNEVWKISLENQEPKVILEKKITEGRWIR